MFNKFGRNLIILATLFLGCDAPIKAVSTATGCTEAQKQNAQPLVNCIWTALSAHAGCLSKLLGRAANKVIYFAIVLKN